MRPRLPPALAVLALVVLPLAVYAQLLAPGRAPADFDAFEYLFPYRDALVQAWTHGRPFPLWNSGIYMGVPFLANIQSAALYPLSLLFLLIPGPAALGWSMVIALAISGAGMFAYAWKNGLRVWGSLAAAAAWELSAHFTVHLGQLNQSGTFAWTPWLMLAFDRAAANPRRRQIAALAIVSALTVLAGHTQQAYLSFVLAGLVGLLRLRTALVRRRWRQIACSCGIWILGVGLGAGVSAAQILPTLELQHLGYRQGGLTLGEADMIALPLGGILGSVLPHYSGLLGSEYAGASLGATVIALALLAIVVRWRRGPVLFWVVLWVLAMWAGTGIAGHLYPILFRVMPGLDLFRVPSRLLLFSSVASAMLAGYGLRAGLQLALAARRRKHVRGAAMPLVTTGIAIALIAGGTALVSGHSAGLPKLLHFLPLDNARSDVAVMAAFGLGVVAVLLVPVLSRMGMTVTVSAIVLLMIGVDGWYATHLYVTRSRTLPASLYTEGGAVGAMIQPSLNQRFLSLVQVTDFSHYTALAEARRPDQNMSDGRMSMDGYDGGVLPLASYVKFRGPLLRPGAVDVPALTITNSIDRPYSVERLRDAGVAYVFMTRGIDPNSSTCPSCLSLVATHGNVSLWRVAGLDPPSRAWVETGGRREAARVVSDTGEHLHVVTPSGAGQGRLVLADTYYPGWSATVDGRPATITEVYGALRAVQVPAGSHRVDFTYAPRSFQVGGALSLASLAVVLVLLAWTRRRARSRGTPRGR